MLIMAANQPKAFGASTIAIETTNKLKARSESNTGQVGNRDGLAKYSGRTKVA